MKRKVVIKALIASVLFIVLYAGIFLLYGGYSPIHHLACELKGDSYRSYSTLGATIHVCVHAYSDAGQKCTSSDECEGSCRVTNDTEVVNVGPLEDKVVGGFGECEADSYPVNCGRGTIENPFGWCS